MLVGDLTTFVASRLVYQMEGMRAMQGKLLCRVCSHVVVTHVPCANRTLGHATWHQRGPHMSIEQQQ